MPLIIPANTLSSGDFVTNSLRISPSDDGFLERTTSGVADSNRRTFTFSWWAKLSVGVEQHLYGFRVNADNMSYLRLNSDGQMRFANEDYGGTVHRVQTNRYFRDPSAWYHIVLRADTTQATETDRIRFYINGVEETSMSSTDYPAQNYDLEINEPDNFIIGAMRNTSGTTTGQVDGYLSEVHFVDGQSYAPTVFGEYNDNGVWIPKDCKNDITYGTRGFYMQFKETGTSANSSGMGADTSGNGNHFTPNNLVAGDITTDTPQNNFATLNPLANSTVAGGTFSEGNVKFVTNQADYSFRPSTIGVSAGKWYCEIKAVSFGGGADPFMIGITSSQPTANSHELGHFANDWGYKEDQKYRNNNSNTTYGDSYTSGDIIGIALDLTNNKLYFSKNGTWQNSGDPTSGSTGTGAISITAVGNTPLGNYFFAIGDYDNSSGSTSTFEANFGNPPFSISSGNADDNGYGNFEYDVPTGYYALCTKNLAEFGG